MWTHQVESLRDHIDTQLKPSLEVPPKVELKELPKHLKYAFLGEDHTLPMMIAANLTESQEQELMKELKENKAAIGWTIADLKSISPAIVIHKIIIDQDVKPVRDSQRRLNPNMREVIMKEVLKWSDAGIIYPISDSKWIIEKLSGQEFYFFLDGYSGYNQIAIHPDDQQRTTFTCPYGTFAFRRMPFG
ncbi:hypothetical protein E3N88_18237 [Mikania micrantha]|uniref:Reverse transcriptase domain-containing protein n=1 Tax=Mikania micrantha TaxID=192012 RepID=A0A5N6NUA5_9ASTR|nr:hypothetical protein E3N88_18237 [Mikania micrantha]